MCRAGGQRVYLRHTKLTQTFDEEGSEWVSEW